MHAIVGHRYFFWALLALPLFPMMVELSLNGATTEYLLHPSGEVAARLLLVALMLTPLRMLFPRAGWLRWLALRRRALGVAAFAYAALHTLSYLFDMGTLGAIVAEFWAPGIWTGWAALAIFLPLAITSNDTSVKAMRRWWKRLHRWAYLAAVLTLVHWIFIHNNLGPALLHFVPLALLEGYRLVRYGVARKALKNGD